METAENILLIDCEFISFLADDFRRNFSQMLGREIAEADLQAFLTFTALDCGFTVDTAVEVVFVHRSGESLQCFDFCDLKELDGKAFKSPIGEFGISCVTPEGFTTIDDFYCDCLQSLIDNDSVRQIGAVCNYEQYGDTVREILDSRNGKTVTLFHVNPISEALPYRTSSIGFPMMKSLGIKGDEL